MNDEFSWQLVYSTEEVTHGEDVSCAVISYGMFVY